MAFEWEQGEKLPGEKNGQNLKGFFQCSKKYIYFFRFKKDKVPGTLGDFPEWKETMGMEFLGFSS